MIGTTAKTDEQAIRDLVDEWLDASKKHHGGKFSD